MARILVIDDDELLRRTIRVVLERAGHEVLEASEGSMGLRLYWEQAPDLVLTDLFMPERDGLEVIRALRNELPQPPIVAMSGGGLGGYDVLEVAAGLGAVRTLRKPFALQDLLDIVRSVLGES